MPNKLTRLSTLFLIVPFLLAFATPVFATALTVHGWELGERITLTNERQVYTAQLDITLENGPAHVASYCVDLDTYINVGVYNARAILDAGLDASPADEASRNLAWAGHVMDNYGHDVSQLVGNGITRKQAITGVQAAIWEGIYGGGIVDASSMSLGAESVYNMILGTEALGDGNSVVADFVGNQDQVIAGASNPVPEPSAAIVFAVGALIAGSATQRRQI